MSKLNARCRLYDLSRTVVHYVIQVCTCRKRLPRFQANMRVTKSIAMCLIEMKGCRFGVQNGVLLKCVLIVYRYLAGKRCSDGTRSRPDIGTMQHSSITLEVYFRTVWKLLLQRLHYSDDIRAKTYVRMILGHPICTNRRHLYPYCTPQVSKRLDL